MNTLINIGVIFIIIGVACIVGNYVDDSIVHINDMLKALHY